MTKTKNPVKIQYHVGMWLSLVERIVRDDEVAGSNPVIPTIFIDYEPEPLGRVAGIFILEVGVWETNAGGAAGSNWMIPSM